MSLEYIEKRRDLKKTNINNNELYFQWWLDDLIIDGCVKSYEREPHTLSVSNPFEIQNGKKKINLLPKIEYTPDYLIGFTEKALDIYVKILENIDGVFSIKNGEYNRYTHFISSFKKDDLYWVYVDVKPPAFVSKFSSRVGSSRDFSLKQRMLLEKERLFINKVIPIGSKNCLFARTFIPKRYYFTDGGEKLRTIKLY